MHAYSWYRLVTSNIQATDNLTICIPVSISSMTRAVLFSYEILTVILNALIYVHVFNAVMICARLFSCLKRGIWHQPLVHPTQSTLCSICKLICFVAHGAKNPRTSLPLLCRHNRVSRFGLSNNQQNQVLKHGISIDTNLHTITVLHSATETINSVWSSAWLL